MKILAYILIGVAVVNFVSFAMISTIIGGDAPNGKIEAGKYFVGGHGHYTEVSRATFEYSTIHSEWFMITLPLAFAGGMILERQRRKKIGHGSAKSRSEIIPK